MPIFDQGYQHWQGPLSGHGWRWLAIARHGVRVQLKNRFLRFLLLIAWVPAAALVVAVAVWGLVEQRNENVMPFARMFLPPPFLEQPETYRTTVWTLFYSYFFKVEMFCIMLLIVVAGPGLISRDLRFNALPLYFARPLTRFDYFLGKLGVIGALVAALAVVPAVVAYVIGVCCSLDLSVIKDTFGVLLASVAYGLVVTLSTGTLILALSSLTRRSLYVGITWAGLWVISWSLGSILTNVHRDTMIWSLQEDEMQTWLQKNPPPPGIQMHGIHANMQQRQQPAQLQAPPRRLRNGEVAWTFQRTEQEIWFDGYYQALDNTRRQAQARVGGELREDWRPLCSYVANLSRMADLLLDTDSAWVAVGKSIGGPGGGRGSPGANNDRLFADQYVAQYPWWWSAAVLVSLVGLSTCILTRRVKSLDRLK
jgi:ABC-2 type transport system permease protein